MYRGVSRLGRRLLGVRSAAAALQCRSAPPLLQRRSFTTQTDNTPDEWLDDANAELAEWFGEIDPNASKRKNKKQLAQQVHSEPSKPSLTEFLLRQKRTAPTTHEPHITQQNDAHNNQDNQTTTTHDTESTYNHDTTPHTPTIAPPTQSIVHHHTHTHHHYYGGNSNQPRPPVNGSAPLPVDSSASSASSAAVDLSPLPVALSALPTDSLSASESFVRRWLHLWNTRHLDQLLTLFSPDCTFTVPHAAADLTGHQQLHTYWSHSLMGVRAIHFEYDRILIDSERRTLAFFYHLTIEDAHGQRFASAMECWQFGEDGLIHHGDSYQGKRGTKQA